MALDHADHLGLLAFQSDGLPDDDRNLLLPGNKGRIKFGGNRHLDVGQDLLRAGVHETKRWSGGGVSFIKGVNEKGSLHQMWKLLKDLIQWTPHNGIRDNGINWLMDSN